jgi:hypothetical protein
MSIPMHLVLALALGAASLALGAASLPGQIISPGVPAPPNPWISPVAPKRMPGITPIYRSGFQGMESVMPEFQGFPTFPTDAAGYGGFPRPPAGLVAFPEFPEGRLPPPAAVARNDWPSWIRIELEAGTGAFAPSRAILVRGSDRVWLLGAEEQVFLPLSYYDKVRVLETGTRIQVRDQGEFQIAFHGGARMQSQGPLELNVAELSEQRIALELDQLTRLTLFCRSHPVQVVMPDGSMLQANLEGRGTDIFLLREGERVLVTNRGPGTLILRSPLHPGGQQIAANQRVTVWLAPYGTPVLAADLKLEGSVTTVEQQRLLHVTGGDGGGALTWSGARIQVSEGTVLRLDPLSGIAFPAGGDRTP